MKMNSKKALKFVTLLITSMLIATVSAATYRYMYIDGSITVSSAKILWIKGSDVPDATISGSTAIVNLNVEQGTPLNFTEALFLKNANNTGSFNYNITITQALLTGEFERAKMHIYENHTVAETWTYVDTMDLTNSTDFYTSSLAAGNYLRMTIEVNATIATGTRDFDVQVQYWAP
jgi:hypothetical protein